MKKLISLLLSFSVIFSIIIPTAAVEVGEGTDTSRASIATEGYPSAIKITPMQDRSCSKSIGGSSVFSTMQSDVPMESGWLPEIGDSKSYTLEVDHSVYPEVYLYAFCCGATGDVTITLNNSAGYTIKRMELVNHALNNSMGFRPKNYMTFYGSLGDVQTYTIVVTTDTGNAGFAFNIGTKETFVEHFGGDNITTVSKTVPTADQKKVLMMSSCFGTTSLLETGEMFHYKADGYTYITATLNDHNTLGFAVFDLETGDLIYDTNSDDCGKVFNTGTSYVGYVTKGLDLERDKDYVILFYTTAPVKSDAKDYYQIYIGVPYYIWEDANYKSSKSYSVSANRQTTFTFNVSGFPQSAMAEKTIISFNTSNSFNNSSITSCVFTAPNGKQYVAPVYGKYSGKFEFDPVDYFGSSNTPLNGKWTVTIKTSQALSGLQFKMTSLYVRIIGKPGD